VVYDTVDPYTGQMETIGPGRHAALPPALASTGCAASAPSSTRPSKLLGNSLAAAEYTGRTIGEGAMPQIALEFVGKMNPEQAKQLRDSFVATLHRRRCSPNYPWCLPRAEKSLN